MKKAKIIVLLLTLTTVFSFAGCGNPPKEENVSSSTKQTVSEDSANLSAEVFEELDTTDMDGNKVDASVFKDNKLTLVNVWNISCTSCIEELPVLDKLNQEYAGKGVAFKCLYFDHAEGISDAGRKQVNANE